ncbi:MAG: hypothetical protein AABZ53_06975 [Planctomycetota bacterium]
MRLLTRNIHRAFVELDPYDDATCWKFIHAARGTSAARLADLAIVLIVGLALTFAGISLWAWLLDAFVGIANLNFKRDIWWILLWVALAPPLLGLGPLAAYFIRDRMLQWRLKFIFNSRARCAACNYSLVGLSLSSRSTVICPECGSECEVAPALGELARATTGRVLMGGSFRSPPRLSTGTRRLLKRVAWVIAFIVFILIPAAAGVWEVLIRRDASLARSDKPRIEAEFQSLMANSGILPRGAAAGRKTTREAIDEAMEVVDAVQQKWDAKKDPADTTHAPLSLEAIYAGADWYNGNTSTPEEASTALADAKLLLGMLRDAGLEAKLRDVANSIPEQPGEIDANGHWNRSGVFLSGSGFFDSQLSRFLHARAFECRTPSGLDAPALLAIVDIRLGLAKVLCTSPMWVDKASGLMSEYDAHAAIVDLLTSNPDAANLAAIESSLNRHAFDSRIRDLIEGNRISNASTVADYFAEPAKTRMGPFSELSRTAEKWTGEPWWPLGWYAENRDSVTLWKSVPQGICEQDAWQRTWTPPQTPGTDSLVARFWGQDPAFELRQADRERLERRGIRLLLAIEKHRVVTGKYPESLSELVPSQLPSLPLDPWSGKSFLYRRVDPALDRLARPYLLYSVGEDRTDDGGVEMKEPPKHDTWVWPIEPKSDVIINRPR